MRKNIRKNKITEENKTELLKGNRRFDLSLEKVTKSIVSAAIVLLSALSLTACGIHSAGAEAGAGKVLKYGKAQGPYTILFEEAVKPVLEARGYVLEAVEFADLLQNDIALNDGEIDFNVEQHTAYANNFNETYEGNLTPVSPIPTVPAGIFSANHTSLEELKEGDKIAVPNDASNTARAYALLQKAGWITLDPEVALSQVTMADIIDNPYNLEFVEMTSVNIPTTLSDFSYAVITGSIVYNAGIDASTSLLSEDILEHLILQVVVKEENKDTEWAQAIADAYHSREFLEYLEKNNNGLWFVPESLYDSSAK